MEKKPKTAFVYYLKNFTAPKVFNGFYYECLLTNQKVRYDAEIAKSTGVELKDWEGEIYNRERFENYFRLAKTK